MRLERLAAGHHDALEAAAADGKLWDLWFTTVPEPGKTRDYIETALAGQEARHMLPWAVRDIASGAIVGSTRYHDIVAAADRVEIGYTWYGKRWQKSHVNTACKLLLLGHAYDFNFNSQRAIEALGAKKDGVIRHHWPRRDGTIRDTVLYSIIASEWPDVRRHLERRLKQNSG